jgi:hypothetical protein
MNDTYRTSHIVVIQNITLGREWQTSKSCAIAGIALQCQTAARINIKNRPVLTCPSCTADTAWRVLGKPLHLWCAFSSTADTHQPPVDTTENGLSW